MQCFSCLHAVLPLLHLCAIKEHSAPSILPLHGQVRVCGVDKRERERGRKRGIERETDIESERGREREWDSESERETGRESERGRKRDKPTKGESQRVEASTPY